MGMAVLNTKYLIPQDMNALRNRVFLRGQRSTTGEVFTRTIADGVTYVVENMTWAADGNATDAIFDIIVEFDGTIITNLRVSMVNNALGWVRQIPLRSLSFVGDGVKILECRLANKSGAGNITAEMRGYERTTRIGDG